MRSKDKTTLNQILDFVNRYYREHHSSPTIMDVAEGVGVARSTTQRYLVELGDRGLLDYSRGIISAPQSAKLRSGYFSAPLVGSVVCGTPEEEEQAMLDDGVILDEDYSADTYEFYRTARVTDYYEVSEDELRKAVGANAR